MADEPPSGRDPGGASGSVGSVAEETARLLDALLGGAPRAAEGPGSSETVRHPAAQPQGHDAAGASGQPTDDGRAEAPRKDTSEPARENPTQVCGSCGQHVGDTPPGEPVGSACHLCPVCQLISVVRSVRPETVDRLADLAAALTQALRDVAATRGAETGRPAAARHRSTVEDIDVRDLDDDDGDDATDEETLR